MKTLLNRWMAAIYCAEIPRNFQDTRPDAAAIELQSLCLQLVADVTPSHRDRLAGIVHLTCRSADFWHLRSALFGTIALSFGERVARDRIARLDALLN
jgi:hypothetical protein